MGKISFKYIQIFLHAYELSKYCHNVNIKRINKIMPKHDFSSGTLKELLVEIC